MRNKSVMHWVCMKLGPGSGASVRQPHCLILQVSLKGSIGLLLPLWAAKPSTVQYSSVLFSSVQFNSIQFNSIQFIKWFCENMSLIAKDWTRDVENFKGVMNWKMGGEREEMIYVGWAFVL